MPTPSLSFAKIVSTPTSTSWSQAYNSGGLFAAVSLTSTEETESLAADGKKLLSSLEAEFYGLEDKSFEAITKTVEEVLTLFTTHESLSLALCYCKDTILYAYLKGSGAITLKRGEKVGTILKQTENENELLRASGYLQTDDIIVIQTAQFVESITQEKLKEALENNLPNDIAETLSPPIHDKEHGGASAIILSFKGAPPVIVENEPDEEEKTIEELIPKVSDEPIKETHQVVHNEKPTITEETQSESEEEEIKPPIYSKLLLYARKFIPSSLFTLNPKQKIIAGIALLLLILLFISILVVKNNQIVKSQKALFNEVYSKAQTQYEEGEALMSLNKPLAEEDFLRAKETLSQLDGKLKPNSDEAQKVNELKEKIEKNLSGTTTNSKKEAKAVELSSYPLLEKLSEENVLAAAEDEDALYILTKSAVASEKKSGGNSEELIENDDTWENAVGMGVYSGNIYVLDPENGLIKFVPAADSYAESTYFKEKINLSKAVSLAIDSSIYILSSEGNLSKYTRGVKDTFKITGLKKPLSSPKSVYTNENIDSLYILDTGNSRVIKLDKSGNYQTEFTSPVLKNATAITLKDDEKTLGILSQGKAYEISL